MRARVQFINRDEDCFHIGGFPGLEFSAIHKNWGLSIEDSLALYEELYLHEHYIEIVQEETVGNVLAEAELAAGIPQSTPYTRGHSLALRIQGDLLRVFDDSLRISTLLKYYPGKHISDAYIVITNVAGVIEMGSGKLRYTINSHEAGRHHYAHVHVSDSSGEKSATILIHSGEVKKNSGLSGKQIKLAKKEIAENKEKLMRHWNMHTDGIKFETDGRFGPVQIVDAGRVSLPAPPYLA